MIQNNMSKCIMAQPMKLEKSSRWDKERFGPGDEEIPEKAITPGEGQLVDYSFYKQNKMK